jgi:hypothetical protein
MSLNDRLKKLPKDIKEEIKMPMGMEKRMAAAMKTEQRKHRTNVYAFIGAVAACVALVIGVFGFLNRGPAVLPQPPIATLPAGPVNIGSQLVSTHAVGTSIWAVNTKNIYKTADNGASWSTVAPQGYRADGSMELGIPGVTTAFVGESNAWVAAWNEPQGKLLVYRTADGGRTWNTVELALPQGSLVFPTSMSFVEANTGFLMVEPDHGMSSTPGMLYATADGGATWTQVANTDTQNLPFGGTIGFSDANTGWLVGSVASTMEKRLFVTHDGGHAFTEQVLAAPAELGNGVVEPMAPAKMSSANDGVIVGQFVPESHLTVEFATIAYTTHDGGNTWVAGQPIKSLGTAGFADAANGMLWSPDARTIDGTYTGPVTGKLMVTTNGGASWTEIGVDATLKGLLDSGLNITNINMNTANEGWAWLQSHDASTTKAIHTTDGGHTWTAPSSEFKVTAG